MKIRLEMDAGKQIQLTRKKHNMTLESRISQTPESKLLSYHNPATSQSGFITTTEPYYVNPDSHMKIKI